MSHIAASSAGGPTLCSGMSPVSRRLRRRDAIADVELQKDRDNVSLDGVLGDEQVGCYLGVAHPKSDEPEHLGVPLSELLERREKVGCWGLAKRFDQP